MCGSIGASRERVGDEARNTVEGVRRQITLGFSGHDETGLTRGDMGAARGPVRGCAVWTHMLAGSLRLLW